MIAQREMRTIDAEVADFHTKMAKSMHSLLKAFTEGFEAMDNAKQEEIKKLAAETNVVDDDQDSQKIKKFDKLHVGISNLESLTNGLKKTFASENQTTLAAPPANSVVQ